MEKLFVPYDTALKLKKKGFDVPCIGKYTKNKRCEIFTLIVPEIGVYLDKKGGFGGLVNYNSDFYKKEGTISAPLYQQVYEWFKEKYNITVSSLDEINNQLN